MVKLLKTEEEYEEALEKLYNFFQDTPDVDTLEHDEFELLGMVVHEYERKHYPIEKPKFDTPIEAIKCYLDLFGLEDSDFQKALGCSQKQCEEILSCKRKLTLPMIRKIHERLKVPLQSLIQAY